MEIPRVEQSDFDQVTQKFIQFVRKGKASDAIANHLKALSDGELLKLRSDLPTFEYRLIQSATNFTQDSPTIELEEDVEDITKTFFKHLSNLPKGEATHRAIPKDLYIIVGTEVASAIQHIRGQISQVQLGRLGPVQHLNGKGGPKGVSLPVMDVALRANAMGKKLIEPPSDK